MIAKNIAALFTGEIISRICHFIAVLYIARLFGAAGFGAISFALAVLSYFLAATNLGLGELGVREIARKREVCEVAGTILSMRVCIAAASFALIVVIALLGKRSSEATYLLTVYGFTLFPYALSLEWVFRGSEKMKYNAYGRTINSIIYIFLILMLVRGERDIIKVAFIALIADSISCVFFYVNYLRKFGAIKLHLDFKRWMQLGKISSQLFISSLLLVVYINFAIIALGFMKNETDVGLYGAASKLIFLIYAISDLLVVAAFPVISRLFHESKDRLNEFMGYCVKSTVIFGFPIAVGGTMLGSKIIDLVYGGSYAQAATIFQILSWFAAANLTNFVLSYSLVAFDKQHLYLAIVAGSAILNGVLNLLFIPLWGYYSSASALVLSEILALLISYLLVRKDVRLPSLLSYWRMPIAAAIMAAFLFIFMKIHVIILILIGMAIYFAALYLLKGVAKSEIDRIKSAFV